MNMCGILMSYGIAEHVFSMALDTLQHRGPFNRGERVLNHVNIGMVQLPMKSESNDELPVKYKSYHVSYNGEIYDEKATNLNKEIEITIESINALKPINGMFAVAAYDEVKNTITLARDEFGIKPIYYYLNEEKKIFIASSEIPAILVLIQKIKPNYAALAEVISFGSQANEDTCFSEIKLLKPGAILSVNLENMKTMRNNFPAFSSQIDNLDLTLKKSVLGCVGDTFRPASLLLSDGLDSNLLVTYLDKNIKKYNIIVNNNDHNVNQDYFSHLYQTHLTIDNYLSCMEKSIASYAQPCRMTSILMYQALSTYIGQQNSHLLLSGEGADEIFWGYPRYLMLEDGDKEKINIAKLFFPSLSLNLAILKNAEHVEHIHEICNTWQTSKEDFFDKIFSIDKQFSLEPLLRRGDHLLMRNTIEVRVPFLHYGIPALAKKMGFSRIKNGISKAPLIDLMKKRNMNYLIKDKQHFRAPIQEWFGNQSIKDHFNSTQLELLDAMGISIDILRTLNDQWACSQIFVLQTMVVWYEKFEKYFN